MRYAPVAQLDRVSGYEPEGRGFESLLAHHTAAGMPAAVFLYNENHSLGEWFKRA